MPRVYYLPKELEIELNNTKKEMGIKSNAEGFRQIVNNARIGKMLKKTKDNVQNVFKEFRI